MKRILKFTILAVFLAFSGLLKAEDAQRIGTLTFNSPVEHIVGIGETMFLATGFTVINNVNPGGESSVERLLRELPPGTDVAYTISGAMSDKGIPVLGSIVSHAP